MKRFLMFVGVAVVAAAMYVAASPASQQASGPTAKQFKALKAQVANCLAVGPVACRLPGAAATYIAPAITATPTSIQNRFIDPPCRPRQLRGNTKDSTTPSRRCQWRR